VHEDDGYFDEHVAARYDESAAEMFDPALVDPVIDLLVEIAGSGRALELGIGTGRIALPLAQRGVPVHGIELSKAMVARLRAKPGGEDIGVTIGDFATTTVDGTFSVAYLVFSTILNLTTQAAQVACFRNVAAHLEPGGSFVIEVGVPALQRLPPWRDHPRLPRERDQMGVRRVRRRHTRPHIPSPRDRRRKSRAPLGSLPVRVALGARPDGTACRHEAARALQRVEAGTVHKRQP
jgi:SAM-dependent methyltransferase